MQCDATLLYKTDKTSLNNKGDFTLKGLLLRAFRVVNIAQQF